MFEVLAEVVATFDHIAAVAIDPDREVRLDDSFLVEDERPFGEVANPQRVAVIARPTATDLFAGRAELAARCPSLAEMAVHGRLGNRATKFLAQECVDGLGRAAWLLLFELDRSIDHGVSFLASLATVLASLAAQTAELVLTKSPHLAS